MTADSDRLLADAARRAARYLDTIGDRSIAPTQAALDALGRFDEKLPSGPGDPLETIALLDEAGSPAR